MTEHVGRPLTSRGRSHVLAPSLEGRRPRGRDPATPVLIERYIQRPDRWRIGPARRPRSTQARRETRGGVRRVAAGPSDEAGPRGRAYRFFRAHRLADFVQLAMARAPPALQGDHVVSTPHRPPALPIGRSGGAESRFQGWWPESVRLRGTFRTEGTSSHTTTSRAWAWRKTPYGPSCRAGSVARRLRDLRLCAPAWAAASNVGDTRPGFAKQRSARGSAFCFGGTSSRSNPLIDIRISIEIHVCQWIRSGRDELSCCFVCNTTAGPLARMAQAFFERARGLPRRGAESGRHTQAADAIWRSLVEAGDGRGWGTEARRTRRAQCA